MHEMSLTRDVVDAVLDHAAMAQADRVLSVHMTVGEIHDIVDDLFVKCFAFLARGTAAEGARVTIDRVPLTVRCKECGEVFGVDLHARGGALRCPGCGGGLYAIDQRQRVHARRHRGGVRGVGECLCRSDRAVGTAREVRWTAKDKYRPRAWNIARNDILFMETVGKTPAEM